MIALASLCLFRDYYRAVNHDTVAAVNTQFHTVTTWEDYVRSMSRDKLIGSEVGVRLIGVTTGFSVFLKAILGVRII